MEGMGFSMLCADRMCDTFQVQDKQEVLSKIEILHSEIRRLEAKKENEKDKQDNTIPKMSGLME